MYNVMLRSHGGGALGDKRLGFVCEELFDFTKVLVLHARLGTGRSTARGDVLFKRRTERGGELGVKPE